MNKKIVSIVIISALIITMGTFSIFANSNGSNTTTNNGLTIAYNYYSSDTTFTEGFSTIGGNDYIYVSSSTHPESPFSDIPTGVKTWYTFTTHYIIEYRFANNNATGREMSYFNSQISYANSALSSSLTRYGQGLANVTYTGNNSFMTNVYMDSSNHIQVQIRGKNMAPMRFAPWMSENVQIEFDIVETLYTTATSPDVTRLTVSHAITGISNTPATVTEITDLDTIQYNDTYNLQRIYNQEKDLNSKVQSILDAYTSNVPGAEDLTDQANSNDQKVATIHEQEQQWYSQNQSAIESTGLQNFEFTSNQTQGLESISNLFNNLWNSLGQWNTVYTFTLMISFSTFLLRHSPRTKRTKKEKSES